MLATGVQLVVDKLTDDDEEFELVDIRTWTSNNDGIFFLSLSADDMCTFVIGGSSSGTG